LNRDLRVNVHADNNPMIVTTGQNAPYVISAIYGPKFAKFGENVENPLQFNFSTYKTATENKF